MGLLDFLSGDDAQLGLGLLAAGGPSTVPMSIGQRLAAGVGQAQASKDNRLKQSYLQSQIDENASQNAARQAQLARQARQDAYYLGGMGGTAAAPDAGAGGLTGSAPAGASGGTATAGAALKAAIGAPADAPAPAQGKFAEWSKQYGIPVDALVSDYFSNSGKGIADMLMKRGTPDMQVQSGYAYDKNKVQPGFLPQMSISQNGQATVTNIGSDGQPVVSAPRGALPTFQAYQGASNRSAADFQGEKVYDTDPNSRTYGAMVLKPRSDVLQPQGGPARQPPMIGPGAAVRGNFTGTPEQVLDQINSSPVPEPVKAEMRRAYSNQMSGNNPAFNPMGTGAQPPLIGPGAGRGAQGVPMAPPAMPAAPAGMPNAPGAAVAELSPSMQSLNKANQEQAASLASQTGPMLKDSADTAVSAVQSVQAAQRLQQAINSDKTLAGPTATLRLKALQISSLMGIPGKDDAEKIANTRQAIQEMAKLTLEGRQQMKGQGAVTNQESALAERATSGSIDDLTAPEISQLAAAAERSARFKYGVHQSRVDAIAKGNPAAASQLGQFAVPALPDPIGQQKATNAGPALPSLPPANAGNRGKTATGSDGSKWASDGMQWKRVQ